MRRINRFSVLFVFAAAAIAAPVVLASTPTGAGPNDPLSAGTWQTLGPHASLWYYFDYTASKSLVEVDLDALPAGNVQLAIYTPDQAAAWLQGQSPTPVGRGTPPGPSSASADHDLVWLGAFNSSGRYFAVVTNDNSTPVSVRVTISGTSVITGPTPTPTPSLAQLLPNPFATPIPTGSIQGHLIFQDASGGNIYTVNGDGTDLTRVTTGLDPSWSPDGTQITFTRWNQPAGVFIANADGSNEQEIIAANQPLSPEWSPDGTRIVFTQQQGGSTSGGQFCFRGHCFSFSPDLHWKLGVVDLTTRALTQPQCSNHCFSPSWFPDNHSIAYADAQFGIMVADTNGGPASTLFNQNTDVQSDSVSPDGSKIAFEVRQHDHWDINVTLAPNASAGVNADGSNVTAVTQPDPLSFAVVNNVAPTWSPDSKQILFLSDRNGKWEFFVVNPDGSGLQQVLKNVTDGVTIHYNFSNERVIDWTK